MLPRVRTRHGEVTAELAWSSSGSRSEITPTVGRTVHLPPPPPPNLKCGVTTEAESVTIKDTRRCHLEIGWGRMSRTTQNSAQIVGFSS
ncbi:hypothetical protein Hanom_Chr06g00487191 [Helianthus anomalus]